MKVEFNSQNYTNNFGMALHMDEKRIGHKIGKVMADEARKARPELEKLAKNCEIRITPHKNPFGLVFRDSYHIRTSKPKSNHLAKIWDNILSKVDLFCLTGMHDSVLQSDGIPLSKILVKNTRDLVKKL